MTVTDTRVVEVSGRDVFSLAQGVVLSRVEVSEGQARCAVAAGVSADLAEVIPLPMMGERIEVVTERGMVEGVWVQRVTGPSTYRDERDGFVAALVLEGGSAPSLASPILRTVRCQAGEWDARRTVVAGSAEPYLRGALAELLSARSAHQAERDEHERWREQLTERAHVEADDRGWCPTFDRFLVEAGLRPRTRDYSVAVEVSFTVYVPVNAIDEDDAMEQVDNHAVREAVRAHDLGSGDWSADSADED